MMRGGVWLALALCAAPAAAQEDTLEQPLPDELDETEEVEAEAVETADVVAPPAQPETAPAREDEFAEAEFSEAAEELDEVWNLDDGAGDEVAWDDWDPSANYGPRGQFHLGTQLRVGGIFGGRMPAVDGAQGELSAFVDLRYAQRGPLHTRISVLFSAQSFDQRNRGGGIWEASSPFAIGVRLYPISVDITDWIALRPGAALGAQWTARPDRDGGEWGFFFSLTGEAVVRLMDGLLEVGVYGGFQLTDIGVTSRGDFHTHRVELQGVLGATAAWLFL